MGCRDSRSDYTPSHHFHDTLPPSPNFDAIVLGNGRWGSREPGTQGVRRGREGRTTAAVVFVRPGGGRRGGRLPLRLDARRGDVAGAGWGRRGSCVSPSLVRCVEEACRSVGDWVSVLPIVPLMPGNEGTRHHSFDVLGEAASRMEAMGGVTHLPRRRGGEDEGVRPPGPTRRRRRGGDGAVGRRGSGGGGADYDTLDDDRPPRLVPPPPQRPPPRPPEPGALLRARRVGRPRVLKRALRRLLRAPPARARREHEGRV